MPFLRRPLAVIALLLAAQPVLAQEVRLASPGDGIVVEGRLTGFDGEFYEIETIYGPLTLDAALMRCEGAACPDLASFVPEVRISGSEDMGEILIPALIEAFADRSGLVAERRIRDERHFDYTLSASGAAKPSIRFVFRLSTTEEGFADLLTQGADVVLASREIRPEERDRLAEASPEARPPRARVIALDALVPLVSQSNPLDELALADLARVAAGDITNWSALGGPDQPIALHLRNEGAGLLQSFADRVLEPAESAPAGFAIRHDTNAALADAVASDPFAIGIGPFSAMGNARPLAVTGPCGFPARASPIGLKTEDYPLTAPLFAYLPDRRLPRLARDLLAFSGSSASALVVRRAGFVDQRGEVVPLAAQGLRLANAIREAGRGVGLNDLKAMVETLFDAERLTITFRFRDGSAELDAQSLSNVTLLAEALEAGFYDDRALIFAGFSDGRGDAGQNRRLSERRAQAVLDAVLAEAPNADLDRIVFEVAGFGEALPMACDEVAWGQRINRRVEIWLR